MEKKEILFLITNTNIGGSEKMLLDLVSKMDRDRFSVSVAALFPEEGLLFDKLRQVNVPVFSLEFRGINLFSVMYRLLGCLKKGSFDAIQVFGLKAELIARPIAKIFGLKVISSIRGLQQQRNILHHMLDKLTSVFVDLYISNSKSGADYFVENAGVNPEKIKVIYNGLDVDKYVTADEESVLLKKQYNVLVLANIWPVKGHKDIVDSLQFIKSVKDSVHFYFLGKDQLNGEVQQYVKGKGLDSFITFLGYRELVVPYIKSADVMLLASHSEGMPVSIMESMLLGTPVIATDVGGVRELVADHKDGLVINPSAPEEIARAIDWSYENREQMKAFADNAQKKIEQEFSLDKMVQLYQNEYDNLIGKK